MLLLKRLNPPSDNILAAAAADDANDEVEVDVEEGVNEDSVLPRAPTTTPAAVSLDSFVMPMLVAKPSR